MLLKLTEMERNWIIFTPYGSIKNLWRSIWGIATWNSREKKSSIPREKNYAAWLVKNSKRVFSKLTGQKFGPKRPSNLAFLAIFTWHFHSGVCTTTTFCFKRYFPCKIWKKPIDSAFFFTFFTTLGVIWSKFCPKITPTLSFYWFPMKYVRGFN